MQKPHARPERKEPKEQRLLVPLAFGLFLAVLAVFWPAGDNQFLNYDDPEYVTSNPHIHAGLTWSTVQWAFSGVNETGNWHPVTWLSHAVDWQLFGQNPRGHHEMSVFLHGLATALLFIVLA